VRLVPSFKLLSGGHRFIFTAEGAEIRIDHELEMTPKRVFKIFIPLMGMMGSDLKDNAQQTGFGREVRKSGFFEDCAPEEQVFKCNFVPTTECAESPLSPDE